MIGGLISSKKVFVYSKIAVWVLYLLIPVKQLVLVYPKIYSQFRIAALGWLTLYLVYLTGCVKKSDDSGRYTEGFLPVFNQTTRFFDADQTGKGIKYLDSAFNEVSSPSYSDRFRFYAFHYVHYQRVLHNYPKALMYADSML